MPAFKLQCVHIINKWENVYGSHKSTCTSFDLISVTIKVIFSSIILINPFSIREILLVHWDRPLLKWNLVYILIRPILDYTVGFIIIYGVSFSLFLPFFK